MFYKSAHCSADMTRPNLARYYILHCDDTTEYKSDFGLTKCTHISPSELQYIPSNMHAVFALLCFVVVIHWLIFPYPSGLLHWHCGNLTIAPVPAKQPWWIWINTLCEFIMNACITTTKQSTTKPCVYFLGYTVWVVYYEDSRGNWPRYNEITLYLYSVECARFPDLLHIRYFFVQDRNFDLDISTHPPTWNIARRKLFVITRDSEVIIFSLCVFVCVCVSVCLCFSRFLSGQFNYEGLVPHKWYFAGILLGMPSCGSYVLRIHDVIDDVTRSQNRSTFEIAIYPSIFELERRSKA